MDFEIICKYLKLFGLDYEASLNDIKKSYRILAKKNHPDRFIDEEQKKKQQKIMAQITEAYKTLLTNHNILNQEKTKELFKKNIKNNINNDYTIYKKGLEYYNTYFDTFFKLFSKRTLINPQEKKDCLIKAKSFFEKLLQEFPDSVWISDSKDKLIKIEKAIKSLD
ncbi:MAG: hypothetical protein A2086_13915 [Spirochaetes bacterium GWD1_27_9]|nr:MAG: hypothetical protein A2Z98_14350 [Spirochaetes bacterium GWB1_27_13]OHD22277.1 MAG: hypothetical protein A2Y34_06125 [Spirochaetes bacterium GWC1_27_15]OHD44093.1 MAG: hypothetical protein A2086_13915 [Spirochaetes bacterium GWD1_27_9]